MQNKIVVIGDIHGRDIWKLIIEKHPDSIYVFLGDYADPQEWRIKDNEVLNNFKDIIHFKMSQPEDVVLLLGNHDIHYFCEGVPVCSRFNIDLAVDLRELFCEYKDSFQNAYQIGNLLFTHAVVTEKWFLKDFNGNHRVEIGYQLNHVSDKRCSVLYQCGRSRGGGTANGGIFWADTDELDTPLSGYIQIVGHNRVLNIEQQWERDKQDTGVIYCDCLLHGAYLIIDLSLQGKERFQPMKIYNP